MPGTSNFGHFDHFSYWKVNFCHFAYQGSVKMPFWPYFDPILSPPEPNLWPLAKMCLFRPTVRMDLEDPWDPKFDLIFDHFGPLWGSWRRLQLDPLRAAFGLKDLLRASQTHARDLKFWSFWPLFLLQSQFLSFCLSGVSENAILTLFWHLSPPEPKPLASRQNVPI